MANTGMTVIGADGIVRAWRAVGPTATPLTDLETVLDAEGWAYGPLGRAYLSNVVQSLDHKRRIYARLPAVVASPVAPIEGAWPPADGSYPVVADSQGVLDFGLFSFAPVLLRAWISTEIEVDRPVSISVGIPAVGPTALRVDDELVGADLRFGYVEPFSVDHRFHLDAGRHTVSICGDMLVWREARLTLGLRVTGIATGHGREVAIFASDCGEVQEESAEEMIRERVLPSLAPEDHRLIATPRGIIGVHDHVESDFRTEPYGTRDERAREALEALSSRRDSPAAAVADLVLGRTERIASAAIDAACTHLERRFDCADFYAVYLHIILHLDDTRPCLAPPDRKRIEDSLTGFKYWIDEPGIDAMCFFTENHQLIFHTAAYLSGRRFPESLFAAVNMPGRRLMPVARARLLAWVRPRQAGGFSEWDSSAYLAMDAYALLAIVEFSLEEELVDSARALLDKLFQMVALQSWRGVHGSSHGRCYVDSLKSARFDGTSGLQRIAWGTGGFEGEHWATLLFALSRNYRAPRDAVTAATDLRGIREVHVRSCGRYRFDSDLRDDSWEVHTLTRRTAHYMLSAALDQRPGEPGIQEHLWQATLGRDALVFTNYPANTTETGHARPNFWAGSVRLPRVRMYGRTVIALYDVVSTVGLGYTHAHFPFHVFDEWSLDRQWAFGRAGSGYVALWSDGDVRPADTGPGAGRELLTTGGRIWICQVGCEEEDGSFKAFTRTLREKPPRQIDTGVRCNDPSGSALELRRVGPFLVDGTPQPLSETHMYVSVHVGTEDSTKESRL